MGKSINPSLPNAKSQHDASLPYHWIPGISTNYVPMFNIPSIYNPISSVASAVHSTHGPSSSDGVPSTSVVSIAAPSSNLNPSLPTVNSNVTSFSVDFNPLLPEHNNDSQCGGDITAAKMIVKPSLLTKKDIENKYSVEALKFFAFVHRFRSSIRNFNLDCYETIPMLQCHVSGNAKKLVDRHEFSAYKDGRDALNAIWKELFTSLGEDRHVRREIRAMLKKVGAIHSKEDVGKLKDLLHVVQLISVNMRDKYGGVSIYDDIEGQLEIANLLPHGLFCKWRTVKRKTGHTPSFKMLKEFLEEEIEDISTLEYVGTKKNNIRGVSLYTSNDQLPRVSQTADTVSKSSPNEKKHSAPSKKSIYSKSGDEPRKYIYDTYCCLHKSKNHDLFECNTFISKSSLTDVQNYIKLNKLCWNCLRPHFRRYCRFKTQCDRCQGSHLTLMYDSEFIKRKGNAENASGAATDSPEITTCLTSCKTPGTSCSKVI